MIDTALSTPISNLFDIPVNAFTIDQTLDVVHETIQNGTRLHIGVVNVAKIVNMRRNKSLRHDVLSSDIILADGSAVVWASRLLGHSLPERVAGIDLMMGILERGNTTSYRVYCLGATEKVSRTVCEKIEIEYPNVKIVGRRNGYFSDLEEKDIATEIASSKPDILFVAMSSPKKENFLSRWGQYIKVPVLHGVGGSFDVMAGKVQRAPDSWQRLGLEWLYRLKQEPRRLLKRYIITNTLFFGMVFSEAFRQHNLPFRNPIKDI